MKFQRYMTGRGTRGYGFRASTAVYPQTPYITGVRESDTGSTDIPVLEILTTKYKELGAVASFHSQEGRASGYMDVLFPDVKDENDPEWKKILDNPGRLLYLPHVGRKEFLHTSELGNNVRIGNDSKLAQDIPIPDIPHMYDFNMDNDMLADLVADIWYASTMRLNNPTNPQRWPVIHIQLIDSQDQIQLTDKGREFYGNKIMPALPACVRPIVSVSIGASYADAVNSRNGGAAAIVIPRYDPNQTEMIPGRYFLTETTQKHQSLNPLGNEEMWRNFGRSVLHFAQTSKFAADDSTDCWLNDFFSISQSVTGNSLSANWIYAFMLFNAHAQAKDAFRGEGAFISGTPKEKTDSFRSNVWEAGDISLLTELGMTEGTARNCMVWLERDMLRALNVNKDILIDEKWYRELMQRAFTLPQESEHDVLIEEISELYDAILTRDCDGENGAMVSWLIGWLPLDDEAEQMLVGTKEERLCAIVSKALKSDTFKPTDEQIEILTAYASIGESQCRTVTEYAGKLMAAGIDPRRLAGMRSVQYRFGLDDSFCEMIRRRIAEILADPDESDLRSSIRDFIKAQPETSGRPFELVAGHLTKTMSEYVKDHTKEFRGRLGIVRQAFETYGAEQTESYMEALADCMEITNIPFNSSDQGIVQPVLCNDGKTSSRMALILNKRFGEALEDMFRRAMENSQRNDPNRSVIDPQWTDCLKPYGGKKYESQNKLKEMMAETIYSFVLGKADKLRIHLSIVQQAFRDIDMSDSRQAMKALCRCMDTTDVPFTSADQEIIQPVLYQNGEYGLEMARILNEHFDKALDKMFQHSNENDMHEGQARVVVEPQWTDCLKAADGQEYAAQASLREMMADTLYKYISFNARDLRDRLDKVQQAFWDIGIQDCPKAMDALCDCMQESDSAFTVEDALIVKQVLTNSSSPKSAERMRGILVQMFEDDLEFIVAADSNCELAYQECIAEKNPSNEQLKLKESFLEKLKTYLDKNAADMTINTNRVMVLYETFEQNTTASMDRVESFCRILEARARERGEGDMLTQQELNVLQGRMLRNISDESRDRLIEMLQILFTKDLPKMIEDIGAREVWKECLKDKVVGPSLRNKVVRIIQEYFEKNADEMYDKPGDVMEVCEVFGAKAPEKLETWMVLLRARQRNEQGQLKLTKEYNDTLEVDIQRARPNEPFAVDMAEVFRDDLPLIVEGKSCTHWVRFRTGILPPRLGVDFDQIAQQACVEMLNRLATKDGKSEIPDYLTSLLTLINEMMWTRSDEVRDAAIKYLRSLKRERITTEEMSCLLGFIHTIQSDMSIGLNEIFERNLPDMLRCMNETELSTWRLAADDGIDLKKTFTETVEQIIQEPAAYNTQAEQIIRPLLTIGRELKLNSVAALMAITMIDKRKEGYPERLMSVDERDELQETVLSAQDPVVWKKYLELLNWEPMDTENKERDAYLKEEAAALRQTAFSRISQVQALEIRGYPVWRKQLLNEVHQRLRRLTVENRDYESFCKIPGKWSENNQHLAFLPFSDLLSYEDSEALEKTCVEQARTVIQKTALDLLKQKDTYDRNTWFGKMMDRMVAERVSEDSGTLVQECSTPVAAQNLLNLINDTGSASSVKEISAALNFALNGKQGYSIPEIAGIIQSMDAETKDITAELMRKALFGESAESWKGKWPQNSISAKIGMAGIICMCGTKPEWRTFIDTVFDQVSASRNGMKNGLHPVQRLLYAVDILQECGIEEAAENLPAQLEKHRPDLYRQMRGAGLKSKTLQPLSERLAEKAGAVYQLLFTK